MSRRRRPNGHWKRRRRDGRQKGTRIGKDRRRGVARKATTMIPPDIYEEIVRIGEVKSQERNKEKAGRIVTKKSPPQRHDPIKVANPFPTVLSQLIARRRTGERRDGLGEMKEQVIGRVKRW